MKLLTLSTAALLSASAIATTCDPLTSSTTCPADTALAGSFKEDFTSKSKYFEEVNSEGLSYSSKGLELTIAKRFDNPSIKSNFYIMFGKVEVIMKAAKGTGIISSFYLQSDDLDEIDIELFGGDAYQFQSNWFSKGSTTTYDRGEYHSMSSSPLDNFHNYTIEYTKDFVKWSLDGSVVRTLLPDNGEGFPQTPMYIMAGAWAGGDSSNAEGTIEWAGGLTDYSDAPFSMYIEEVVVVDYSTGSEYSYSDQSGDWSSIEAKGGKVNGREDEAKSDFDTLVEGGDVEDSFSAQSTSTSSSSSSSSSSTSSSSSASSSSALSSSASSSSSSTSKTFTLSSEASAETSSETSESSKSSTSTASAKGSTSENLSTSTAPKTTASSHFTTSTTGGALSTAGSSSSLLVSSADVAGLVRINAVLGFFALMGYFL